ncbi:TPA: hypothetical protein CPT85_08105 [Candidatus Gastranaerophilales bacterium HUM_21]|nr:MAG TPA: hypothetical protein CPT85_08105 [Candidatus Gastranaerophilales bacterium HUM_21]
MVKSNESSFTVEAASASVDSSINDSLTGSAVKDDQLKNIPYHTRLNPPVKRVFKFTKPTRVQESPLDARSPQEVLDYHGMYKDDSLYKNNPNAVHLDLTAFDDLQTSMNKNILAQEKFNQLPVDVRARFNHSIVEFTQRVTSPDFDINEVLLPEEQKAYSAYKADEKARKEYESYLNSSEYKQQIQEAALRKQFEKEQFEAWKASKK